MRNWTFRLPAPATFHDGSPVTPEAVAFALELAADEAARPLAAAVVERVVPVDDGVRFEVATPYPTLPAVLAHYSTAVLAPSSYAEGGRVIEVVGTGPYEVEQVEMPASIEVTRFDGWRGEAPDIERVVFQAVARAESRALMATSDQADVGLHPGLLARRPAQVSGGELQRLAIVRAMLLDPALVFADEATSRLDLVTQERTMRCLMSELTEAACALLLVTHDRELADAVCDHHLQLGETGLPVASTVPT